MEAFTSLVSTAVSLPDDDIDTDIIFPARFLLITEKMGLGRYAFFERRQGDAAFPIGSAPGAAILIAGRNFGCGSSREQAVWALHDLGFRCIMAPSFGEIFQANCYRSGVLPIVLPRETLHDIASAGGSLTVDLAAGEIRLPGARVIGFSIPAWRRESLLNGWDEVLTLLNTRNDAITSFERRRRHAAPWLFASETLEQTQIG